ncbi:hypothetical protein MRX96_035926 [Rhipicephalus microplus]
MLESTRIEDDSMVSSDTYFATVKNLSPVPERPTLPLTPLVERLCQRLEPSLRQDIQKKMDTLMAQSILETTSATVRDRTLDRGAAGTGGHTGHHTAGAEAQDYGPHALARHNKHTDNCEKKEAFWVWLESPKRLMEIIS